MLDYLYYPNRVKTRLGVISYWLSVNSFKKLMSVLFESWLFPSSYPYAYSVMVCYWIGCNSTLLFLARPSLMPWPAIGRI